MRDYKNIDRIFQENLKDFEVFPPNKSWDEIEKQLSSAPIKRRIPFWVKFASVAALLALFFTVGTIYFIPKNSIVKNIFPTNFNNEILDEKDSVSTAKKETEKLIQEKKSSKQNDVKTNSEELISSIENNSTTANNTEEISDESSINKKSLNKYTLTDAENLPLENINSIDKNSKKEINSGKITVATIFAPIYFNSFGSGSGVDEQFRDNSTSGNSSYSYGVKIAYQLNNKFTLQSGVNLINLGYKTNDVYITPGVAVVSFANLSNSPVLSKSENIKAATKETLNASTDTKGSLNQVFGYVEIPVEVKYNVADGKLGVNLVGGFSTLLLNKDEVYIETNSFSQSLGSSNNLRDINFSGNIGVDVDYLINKNLYINISPMFKVQTNNFSKNSGSFQPYYLGVYTGLNYKF